MLEAYSAQNNRLARGMAAGFTCFAATILLAGVGLGITKPPAESTEAAYRKSIYASLLATGGGVLWGLLSPTRPHSVTSHNRASVSISDTWIDWRNFVVVRKVKESEEITSFYLKPEDGQPIPTFQPGQFLTIRLNIPGQARPVIRTYSLSDYTPDDEYYRLSIKREPAPKGADVPPGLASNFMHNHVTEGTVIPAKPPNGKFVVNVARSLPVVFISNGVGITPMISMAKAITHHNRNRHFWFLHGTRDSRFHAFRQEIDAIVKQNPNAHLHYRYSRPQLADEGLYHSAGYIDTALIQQQVLPEIEKIYGSTEAEYFLCGSPAFMQSLQTGLAALGVPDSRVFYESFGPEKRLVAVSAPVVAGDAKQESEIVFSQAGETFTWHPEDGTILEFAESKGLNPPYSCRQGICLTCMCRIQAGEVEYDAPPIGTPDQGSVLICIAKPKTSRVTLEL
jgi:hypothetical protein